MRIEECSSRNVQSRTIWRESSLAPGMRVRMPGAQPSAQGAHVPHAGRERVEAREAEAGRKVRRDAVVLRHALDGTLRHGARRHVPADARARGGVAAVVEARVVILVPVDFEAVAVVCLPEEAVWRDGVVAHRVRRLDLNVDAELAGVRRAHRRSRRREPLAVGDGEGLAAQPHPDILCGEGRRALVDNVSKAAAPAVAAEGRGAPLCDDRAVGVDLPHVRGSEPTSRQRRYTMGRRVSETRAGTTRGLRLDPSERARRGRRLGGGGRSWPCGACGRWREPSCRAQ
eukprot:7380758-Prymnesium_polylepis.1